MKSKVAAPPRIPHAEFQQHLGSGGFADVYLYRQRMPERDIAVKVIRPEASAEQNGAFEAEANLMAKMSAHPAILSVFGAGVSEDNRSYLMMEYCPPPHLGVRARKQSFPVTTVLDIGVRIAGAVETLHRAGVLHRDIKPANILMTQFGHPVLTDFGIAVARHDADTGSDTGFSIPWASPEQAMGTGANSPAMDVYSLAATLHTLLTGHSPFEIPGGDNREISMLNRVLRDPVPPTGRSDVPLELERILAIAMAKQPEQRYPTVLAFAQALQRIQEELHQRPTVIDVLDDHVSVQVDEVDDEATRVRAFTMIDQNAQITAPGKTLSSKAENTEDATRIGIRRIDPTLLGTASPAAPSTPSANARPQSGQPAASHAAGVALPSSGISPAHQPAAHTPGSQAASAHPGVAPSSDPGHGTGSAGLQEDHSQFFGEATPKAEGSSLFDAQSEEEKPKKRSIGRIIAIILVSVVFATAVAFGVWTYLHNRGGAVDPQNNKENEEPAKLPVQQLTKGVTGLTGKDNKDGTVTFTWDEIPDVEYLFTVEDPLEQHQLRVTDKETVTVDKVDGRTCLKVFVKVKDKPSEGVTQCVETP